MKQRYLESIQREILGSPMAGRPNWIYIGGGTPNTLSVNELSDYIVSPLKQKVRVETLGIELLPSLLSRGYLADLKSAGFTKISMGIESFDRKVLKRTGRTANRDETIADLIRQAKSIGLFVSTDMMVGLPGQDDGSFLSDIKKAAAISPDQIITYPYMVLRGTENGSDLEEGRQFELIEEAHRILNGAGYQRTCVWTSQQGTEYYDSSRDELVEDYIGFGPAAFSTYGNWKTVNPELAPYLKSMSNGRQMAFVAPKDPATDMWRKFARMIYDLRCERSAELPFYLNLFIRLLKISGYSKNNLLNRRGRLFANEITKTVVETLPFPIQNKDIVSNYDEYRNYSKS